jgi:hypothetical protein
MVDSKEAQPDYQLTVRPEPGPVPAIIRLRRFLKAALRVYGLKCIDMAEVKPAEPPGEPPAGAALLGDGMMNIPQWARQRREKTPIRVEN